MDRSEARTAASLAHLAQFFGELEERFVERRDPLTQIALALLARQHVLLTGPPGTAKSQLTAAVLGRILDEASGAPSLFARQITESTVQTDLIGAVDFRTLMDSGRTTYFTDEGILGSVHAFLDEVLDGRDMLLRATLNLLEERELKQGGRITRGAIECAVMTTNRYLTEVLEENRRALLAFVDRIAFVSFVPRTFADPAHLRRLVRSVVVGSPQPSARLSIQDLDALQALTDEVVVPGWIAERVADLVTRFEQRTGELARADPAFVATRYTSTRTAVRLVGLLRAIVVLDKARGRTDRALVAELSDLATLRLALMVSGPTPEDLERLLAQEHEPRERRQLTTMKTELELFEATLAEIVALPVPEPTLEEGREQGPTARGGVEKAELAESESKGAPPAVVATEGAPRTTRPAEDLARDHGRELGDLAGVALLLERSREVESRRDEAGVATARALRQRALDGLTELVGLGGLFPTETPRSTLEAEAEAILLRDACELREALFAEGATLTRPTHHALRWEAATRTLLLRTRAAIDAEAASRVASLPLAPASRDAAVDGAHLDQLLASLVVLEPVAGALRRIEASLRAAGIEHGDTLREEVLGRRLGPLVEAAYRRGGPLARDAVRGRVASVVGRIESLGLGGVLDPAKHLGWLVAALLADDAASTRADDGTEPPGGSRIDQYRALRSGPRRTLLALVVAELAADLAPCSASSPLARAAALCARIEPTLRRELVRVDLARIERELGFLEQWLLLPLGEESELARVVRDERALVRAATELELVRALAGTGDGGDPTDGVEALEARLADLDRAITERLLAERIAETEARWRALLPADVPEP